MPSGGGEGVGQLPSSLSEEPVASMPFSLLAKLHHGALLLSRQCSLLGAAEVEVVVSPRRLCLSSLEIFGVVHVWRSLRSVWWMRVYYGVGGWVGQAYIISLAPHPGGQQQKVPFTTKVRRTSIPAPVVPPTPTPTPITYYKNNYYSDYYYYSYYSYY